MRYSKRYYIDVTLAVMGWCGVYWEIYWLLFPVAAMGWLLMLFAISLLWEFETLQPRYNHWDYQAYRWSQRLLQSSMVLALALGGFPVSAIFAFFGAVIIQLVMMSLRHAYRSHRL